MIERLKVWWRGLGRRERLLVAIALTVVGTVLFYAIAVEPAWRTRSRLARELPKLQEDVARMEALREEARALGNQGAGRDAGESLRVGAERSLQRAGIAGTVRDEGDRGITVKSSGLQAQAWFAWLDQFSRESRTQVMRARVVRAAGVGLVDAEVLLEVPAR
ncbi:MAG: type II secretion system protein GspM [Burkholderiales bacterium]